MARNLILTGGATHSFPVATPALAALLAEHGFESTISEDIESSLAALDKDCPELLTVYALRWTMSQNEKYAPLRERWAFSLSDRGRAAILSHLERGGGLVALHTALICFDDWPGWKEILGGGWTWGHSSHPPYGKVEVRLDDPDHPLLHGLDGFTLDDEVYGDLQLRSDVQALLHARAKSDPDWQPVLWTRRVGPARIVVDALGHDIGAFTHPVHRRMVARAALWAIGRSDEEIDSA
jgi:type 1 glutamine amidotransferase